MSSLYPSVMDIHYDSKHLSISLEKENNMNGVNAASPKQDKYENFSNLFQPRVPLLDLDTNKKSYFGFPQYDNLERKEVKSEVKIENPDTAKTPIDTQEEESPRSIQENDVKSQELSDPGLDYWDEDDLNPDFYEEEEMNLEQELQQIAAKDISKTDIDAQPTYSQNYAYSTINDVYGLTDIEKEAKTGYNQYVESEPDTEFEVKTGINVDTRDYNTSEIQDNISQQFNARTCNVESPTKSIWMFNNSLNSTKEEILNDKDQYKSEPLGKSKRLMI